MRVIFALVLLVGLGLAGGAVYMAQGYIQGYQTELAKERATNIETVRIYVANRALSYGEEITEDDLDIVRFPVEALPEGVFDSRASLFPEGDDRPRYVLRAIEEKEAILEVKLTKRGEDAGLMSRLERGMRAFAIKVDVASGVSGFLRPGDRVDVYWTGRVKGSGGRIGHDDVTKLIEANVSLIAIDQSTEQEGAGGHVARTVTVAVTPQQVAALAQARSTGKLSLALVGAQDDTVATAIEVDQQRLLGIEFEEEEVVQEVPKEKVCTIRTRKGAEVVQIPIPCTN